MIIERTVFEANIVNKVVFSATKTVRKRLTHPKVALQ